MIDWRCTQCGFKPELITPTAYDGWWRFEVSLVGAGVVHRGGLYTLCSIDCIRKVIAALDLAALRAGEALKLEELKAKKELEVDLANFEAQGPSE